MIRWVRALRSSGIFDFRGRERRKLRARIDKLERALKIAQAKLDTQRAALERSSAERHRRRVLSPAVLRDLLPRRAVTLPARARYADAERYDARLQEISPAYRHALAGAGEPHPQLVRTAVEGLSWWVPVSPALSATAVDRVVAKQRFPYRNITQTRELTPGLILLDIGANVGRMSIPRVILGDCQRAYCAEPDPVNYAALVRNVAGNGLRGLVLPDRAAISSVTGTAALAHAKYSGGHRLLTSGQAADGAIQVTCWTLDDWCARLSIDPNLVAYVKVDTQGHELHVLHGASRLLAYPHIAWQLEVSPAMLDAVGSSAGALFDVCTQRFSHFIDLDKHASGRRVRPTRELAAALDHLRSSSGQTDILLFNATAMGAPLSAVIMDS